MALIFCMQLTHEKVEQVAFPASLGRDVSILWYSVHNAKGMPALLLPLWLKHFSSFWTVSSVNLSFSCNHLPEICFISTARLTGLAQLRMWSILETHRQQESMWDLPVVEGCSFLGVISQCRVPHMLLLWLTHLVHNQAMIEINIQVNSSSKSFIQFGKGVSVRLC